MLRFSSSELIDGRAALKVQILNCQSVLSDVREDAFPEKLSNYYHVIEVLQMRVSCSLSVSARFEDVASQEQFLGLDARYPQ